MKYADWKLEILKLFNGMWTPGLWYTHISEVIQELS